MTMALAAKIRHLDIGATVEHRGKLYRVEQCTGEAHSNPYIDNCGQCAPLWGKTAVAVHS